MRLARVSVYNKVIFFVFTYLQCYNNVFAPFEQLISERLVDEVLSISLLYLHCIFCINVVYFLSQMPLL